MGFEPIISPRLESGLSFRLGIMIMLIITGETTSTHLYECIAISDRMKATTN